MKKCLVWISGENLLEHLHAKFAREDFATYTRTGTFSPCKTHVHMRRDRRQSAGDIILPRPQKKTSVE